MPCLRHCRRGLIFDNPISHASERPSARGVGADDVDARGGRNYDRIYRVESVTGPLGKTLGYAYDAADRRQTMRNPDNGLFSYTRDAVGNITLLVNPLGEAATTTFDPLNQPLVKTLGNGAVAGNVYDQANRLVVLENLTSAGAANVLRHGFRMVAGAVFGKLGKSGNPGLETDLDFRGPFALPRGRPPRVRPPCSTDPKTVQGRRDTHILHNGHRKMSKVPTGIRRVSHRRNILAGELAAAFVLNRGKTC